MAPTFTAASIILIPVFMFSVNAQTIANGINDRNESQNQTYNQTIYRYPDPDTQVQWDTLHEPWLNFQARMCPRLCNGTQLVKYVQLQKGNCEDNCFPCDCNVTCPIYGTCCPQFHPDTPLKPEDGYVGDDGNYFYGDLSDYKLVNLNDDPAHFVDDPGMTAAMVFQGRFLCVNTIWPEIYGYRYYMVATCPPSESNQTLRLLCESTNDNLKLMSPSFLEPLTDTRSGLTFKNKYCVKCNQFTAVDLEYQSMSRVSLRHGEHLKMDIHEFDVYSDWHLQRWNIKVECASYQQFHQIASESEFLTAVLKDTKKGEKLPLYGCKVTLKLPAGVMSPHKCISRLPPLPQDTNNISACIRGDSPVYAKLDNLCQSVSTWAFRSWEKVNIFCYLCQGDFPPCAILFPIIPNSTRRDGRQVLAPLAFLLGSRSSLALADGIPEGKGHKVTEVFQCDHPLQWKNEQGVCQLPQCEAGKRLNVDSESCDTAVTRINGLRYKIFTAIFPNHVISRKHVKSVQRQVWSYFPNVVSAASLVISCVIYRSNSSVGEDFEYIKFISVRGSVKADPYMYRDNFESSLLMPQVDENDNNTWISLFNHSVIYWGEGIFSTLLNDLFSTRIYDSKFRIGVLGNNEFPDLIPRNASLEERYHTVISRRFFEDEGYNRMHGLAFGGKSGFIDLNPSLLCPYVEFNISNIYSNNGDDVTIGFNYQGEEKLFNVSRHADGICIKGGRLRICIDVFRDLFQKISIERPDNANQSSIIGRAIYYTTLVCLGISVFSLVLSITTYLLFPVLRNLPGLNTLTLCICLAFAQLCLIVVTLIVGRIEGWPCQLLGILLHYGWLTAFHWMSVCCIHMFIVFNKTQARTDTPNVMKPYLKYSVFAFGVSAFYVGLHITISEILSGGVSFGYSPQLCLFDTMSSKLASIFTFILPLGIVVLSNGILFFVTVRKIMSIRRLQSSMATKKKSRDEMVTYVKLSTLTGLFWLLAILAVQLDNEVLTFVSTALVTLQGLFIFMSFTVNARVKSLYMALLGFSNESSASKTTITDTTRASRSLVTKDSTDA